MENLEKWDNFSSQGKVREFLTDGKSQGILPKILENEGILHKILEKFLASFYFYFFFDFLIEVYLLNRFLYLLNSFIKHWKNTGKMERKYW